MALRMLVLTGVQIINPVFWLYTLLERTSAGRYFPISRPLVGSKSSQTRSFLSGMYCMPTSIQEACIRVPLNQVAHRHERVLV